VAYVLAVVELPESARTALRRLRRPLDDVLWFDPVDDGEVFAPLRRSWSDEWGYLPLAKGAISEDGVDRFDELLDAIRLPPFSFSISRLTFLLDPEPVRICARVDVSPGLAQLVRACADAGRRAGGDFAPFDPLLPLANCFGATREDLTAYSKEVEPFAPIEVRCDQFLMCSRVQARSMESLELRLKVDFEYSLG